MSLFEKLNNKRYNLQEKKKINKKSFPSGSFDPANQEGKFVDNEAKKNLNKNKDSLENTLKQNTKQNRSDRKLDQLKQQERISKQYDMGGGEVTGTPQDQTYKPPSKEKVEKIQKKSIKNQADAGKRAKTFRRSFGTPTGADFKTGKPTYKPSFTIDAKGKKKIGADIELPRSRTSGVPEPDKITGLSGYDRASKTLGDREASKLKYVDTKTNKASPEGVKRYISKARQMRIDPSGITPVDQKTTDVIATSAGGQYRAKIDTKYGGRRATLKGTQQPIKTQEPQSNARRNMNRTLNFKNFRKKLKNIKSTVSGKFSNFNKRLKDPTRGFAPYKKGIRANLGNIKRYKHGGKLALAGLIAAPYVKSLATTGINALRGREKVSSKNSKDTGPLFDTKTGQNVKFGYTPSGKPQGTVGSLFDKKVKSKVYDKLKSGQYDFKKYK